MANNSVAVSQLPNALTVASTDEIVVLYNAVSNASVANGSPSVRTISVTNFSKSFIVSNNVPANSSSMGVAGNIAYDNTHFYVCVSSNTWLRTNLGTF